MPGSDNGSSSGSGVRKRQASESQPEHLESGQEEPSIQDPGEISQVRKLYRALLVQSLKDLGDLRKKTTDSVVKFFRSEQFEEICVYADWESEWLRDVFEGVLSLPENVRREIAFECAMMLKAIGRL